MINVKVTGTGVKKDSKILRQACEFYARKLRIVPTKYCLDIRIKLCEQEEDGLCDYADDKFFPEIEITINKNLSDEDKLKTLAHEMTHGKQFLRKELKYKNHTTFWKGQASENQEWEDEAYLMEEKLYSEFINANN